MKRPLIFVLIGIVLGEAAILSLGWKGLILPVCIFILFGGIFLTQHKNPGWLFCVSSHISLADIYRLYRITGIFCLIFVLGGLRLWQDMPRGRIAQYFLEANQEGENGGKNKTEESLAGNLVGRVESVSYDSEDHVRIILKKCSLIVKHERIYDLTMKGEKKNSSTVEDEVLPIKGACRVVGISAPRGSILPGERYQFHGELAPYEEVRNPGEFNSKGYYTARGIFYQFYADSSEVCERSASLDPILFLSRLMYEVRERVKAVYHELLTQEEEGVLDAIVLGDKAELTEEMKLLYQDNGLAHLLAISGLHVSIVGGAIYRALRKRGFSYLPSCLLGGSILFLYGIMTGMGSSVMRASLMYSFFLVAELTGQQYDLISAMSLSGILMLLEHPFRVIDGGFFISFGSVFAIGGVLPFMQELREKKRMREKSEGEVTSEAMSSLLFKLKEAFLSSAIISFATLPCILYFYYQWSPYSILLNMILIPLMNPLMISGMAGGFAGLLSSYLGIGILCVARVLIHLYKGLLLCVSYLPGSLLITGCPRILGVIGLYALEAAFVSIWYHSLWKKALFPSLGIACSFYLLGGQPSMRITMLDVGQGDCILLSCPNGKHILIDGGSTSRKEVGEYVIKPALKYYGIGSLDYVILSHMDEDHINGIKELYVDQYPIERIILPDLAGKDSAYQEVEALADQDQSEVISFAKGDRLQASVKEGFYLECLHPQAKCELEDRNDASIVLHLHYGDFDMLFTGDIGEEGERVLLPELRKTMKKENVANMDILKVAHHGSAYSSCQALLEQIKPELSIISAGKNNRYGHPHKETLERLEEVGSLIYRTDQRGAILVETNGKGCSVKTYLH